MAGRACESAEGCMKKWPRNIMALLAGVTAFALLAVVFEFVQGNNVPVYQEEEKRETLTIMAPYGMPQHKLALENIADAYSAMEGRPEVDVVFVPPDLYKEELGIQLDRGVLPDLVICENVAMPALVSMGVFQEMTDFGRQWAKNEIYSYSLLQNTMNNGLQYGLPFTCDPYVLFYNKNAMEQKGVELPKTWSQLSQASEQLSERGSYGFGIAAMQQEEVGGLFMQMLYSTGGSVRDMTGEDGMRLFNLLREMAVLKRMPPDCINWNEGDLTQAFLDGEVVMMAAHLSMGSVIADLQPGFQVGVEMLPIDKKEIALVHGQNIGITTTAKTGMAEAFISYLMQPDILEEFVSATGSLPTRMDMDYKPKAGIPVLPETQVRRQRQGSMAKSSFRSWFNLSAALQNGVYDLLAGSEETPEQIAQNMQDQVRIAVLEGA